MIENTITNRPFVGGEVAGQLACISEATQELAPYISRVEKGDCSAVLEPRALTLLADVRTTSPAEYARLRALLKQANTKISLGALDGAVTALNRQSETKQTHHGYAKDILGRLALGKWSPVAHEGSLYAVDPTTSLWLRQEPAVLARLVAETHDGSDNCSRSGDYAGVAQHAISLASDDSFFVDAPVGIACPAGFYAVVNGRASSVPLTPAHRQRVQLQCAPCEAATPLFDAFLHQTFQSTVEGEEEEQRKLVQEVAGAIMLGLMPRFQKAILFYDPFGRAGKGTLESILRRLVPHQHVTSISPFLWSKEYFLMALAGSRLNVVGELPDNESIPAASFKSVIGGDLLTGRNPAQKPISFKNEAAHLFMSNHLIHTREHSEAFFARWIIVEFPNSLLLSGATPDPALAARIIEKELPGIAHWALQGATRLLETGKFSDSMAHARLMQKWRRSNSSLDEYIHDVCELDASAWVKRAEFYQSYREWCRENGRLAFAKGKVLDLLAANIVHGIRHAKLDGYEIFRGVQFKTPQKGDPLDF
jgi:P4 family phage/plasmid primase-like protien